MKITKKELREDIEVAELIIKALKAETQKYPYMKRVNDIAVARWEGMLSVYNNLLYRDN